MDDTLGLRAEETSSRSFAPVIVRAAHGRHPWASRRRPSISELCSGDRAPGTWTTPLDFAQKTLLLGALLHRASRRLFCLARRRFISEFFSSRFKRTCLWFCFQQKTLLPGVMLLLLETQEGWYAPNSAGTSLKTTVVPCTSGHAREPGRSSRGPPWVTSGSTLALLSHA